MKHTLSLSHQIQLYVFVQKTIIHWMSCIEPYISYFYENMTRGYRRFIISSNRKHVIQ